MVNNPTAKRKRPTMYDVAKLAGVSQPTVSRVLNPNEMTAGISDETTERVLAAVKKLGYRTNVVARSLRTRRTQTIAMMIADLSNGFYHTMARAVQDVARQHDYEVLISNSDHLYENEKHFCEVVLGRAVDGVIMVPIRLTTADLDHYVSQTHIPFVVLAEQIVHPDIDVVYVDDERATYEGIRWLIDDCGYHRIGYVGVPDVYPPGPRRWKGFTRAVLESGLPLDERYVRAGDFTLEGGRQVANAMIATGNIPEVIMVINDLMAIGMILGFQEAGYNVPEEVAVMGFDDISEARIIRPTLTTIAQNPRDIGTKLAKALFERINDPDITGRRVFQSSCELMIRQSTQLLAERHVVRR